MNLRVSKARGRGVAAAARAAVTSQGVLKRHPRYCDIVGQVIGREQRQWVRRRHPGQAAGPRAAVLRGGLHNQAGKGAHFTQMPLTCNPLPPPPLPLHIRTPRPPPRPTSAREAKQKGPGGRIQRTEFSLYFCLGKTEIYDIFNKVLRYLCQNSA